MHIRSKSVQIHLPPCISNFIPHFYAIDSQLELLDVNIKKEMSEEVMDLEANVSNILNLNMGAIQEDRMT